MCVYFGQHQIMDLYKNIALNVNTFITFISKKETTGLLFPQNDEHSQTT
jgi:hypothetical protein